MGYCNFLLSIFCVLFFVTKTQAQTFVFNPAGDTITDCTGCNGLAITIPADNGGTPVTTIGAGAFNSDNLISVIILSNITTIGNDAFSSNNLTSVTIPNSVTSMGNSAFESNNLTSVTISNSITSIGDNTFGSNDLTSVTIPNSVTSIGESAFEGNNLSSVTIPGNITTIGDAAFESNALTTIIFEGDRPTLGTNAFSLSPGLTTINFRTTTIGWPGANIQGITPTLLAFSSANTVPTLPPILLLFLSLCVGLMVFNARKTYRQ